MLFKKKREPQPFVPLSLDQLLALTDAEREQYWQAHGKENDARVQAIQEQLAAQAQAIQEQSDAQERASRERMKQDREETERTLREIAEQGRQQMARQQQETTNMMQRAFSNPETLVRLLRALNPQPPAVPQLGNEQIIEGEILSSEEISTPKKETTDRTD